MRTSRILGVVATGLIAVCLGAASAGATAPDMSHGISQHGSNSNDTEQKATSNASTEQKNVNFPISLFSVGANNGDVSQYNDASTQAASSNGNWTQQWLNQNQDGSVPGNGPVSGPDHSQSANLSQTAGNFNETEQKASSKAETEQVNVNAPISVFSVGSNNGAVHQGNEADTSAASSNRNWTDQRQSQDQSASERGSSCGCSHDSYGPEKSKGCGDVSQSGSNGNETDQHAKSEASTKQVNVNAPISLFSVGSNNGDVHQGNSADTHAGSSNDNGTQQSLGQNQSVVSGLGV